MKQRVTYLLPEGSSADTSDIKVSSHGFTYAKANQASKEWRLTIGLHELPAELKLVLASCHEVHARFVSPESDQLIPPLVSRLPPGLHLHWTPKKAEEDATFQYLVRHILGHGRICSSTIETCTELPIVAERSRDTVSFQYYHFSTDERSRFVNAFLGEMCNVNPVGSPFYDSCRSSLLELADAASIDFDFGSESRHATLTARLGKSEGIRDDSQKRDLHQKLAEDDRLEVGVLESQQAKNAGELSLGGYLTVVGENDRPKSTFFSFASRHHSLPVASAASFTSSFQQPTGLHPKLQIKLSRGSLVPSQDTCSLHAYMTLPSTLFIDRYQLSDRLFLNSQNLIALNTLIGEQDLEAPEWVVSRWGSAALLQLAVPSPRSAGTNDDWISTIPMHLRYVNGPISAKNKSSETEIEVPWPVLFWACQAEEEAKLSNNPFDRTKLGYDDLFESNTLFYHIPPAIYAHSTVAEIKVPVLSEEAGDMVQVGTLLAVALGFIWICWQLLASTKLTAKSLNKHKTRN